MRGEDIISEPDEEKTLYKDNFRLLIITDQFFLLIVIPSQFIKNQEKFLTVSLSNIFLRR